MPVTEIAAIFRQPFTEQVTAFRKRLGNLVPTSAWDDVWQAEHDRAFMVAGAIKADLLTDLGAAVDRAVSEGTGLEAFRRDFRQIVENRGWHGWTGEGSEGGEAWRTRVIYRTNMATSYHAGRFAQLEAGGFKYWVYRHGGSIEPRLHHLRWDGIALEPGHRFWLTHYTPNGWGCSCYVVGARTRAGIARVGGNPDKVLPDGWEMLDAKTGAPSGIGKGWAYAPGASVSHTVQVLAEKAVSWPAQISVDYMAEVPASYVDEFARAYRALTSVADDLGRFAANVEAGTGTVAFRPLGAVPTKWAEPLQAVSPRQMQFAVTREGMASLIQQGHTKEELSQLGAALNDITEIRAAKGAVEVHHPGGIFDMVADLPDLGAAVLRIVGWRTS